MPCSYVWTLPLYLLSIICPAASFIREVLCLLCTFRTNTARILAAHQASHFPLYLEERIVLRNQE